MEEVLKVPQLSPKLGPEVYSSAYVLFYSIEFAALLIKGAGLSHAFYTLPEVDTSGKSR